MRAIWPGLCLLLPLTGMTKDHPTAECRWLLERIEILEKAIKQGDELGTREELAKQKVEVRNMACNQYDY